VVRLVVVSNAIKKDEVFEPPLVIRAKAFKTVSLGSGCMFLKIPGGAPEQRKLARVHLVIVDISNGGRARKFGVVQPALIREALQTDEERVSCKRRDGRIR
jgi:hypothetical protein